MMLKQVIVASALALFSSGPAGAGGLLRRALRFWRGNHRASRLAGVFRRRPSL